MKAIKLFLYCVLFCLSYLNSFSQWVDKGEYQEIYIGQSKIINFAAPKNENYFYTLTADLTYSQFDYKGNS